MRTQNIINGKIINIANLTENIPINLIQYGDAISKINKLNTTGKLTVEGFTLATQGLNQAQIINLATKNKDILLTQAKNKEDLAALLTKHGMTEAQATETAATVFNTAAKGANSKATLGQTFSNLGLLGSIKAVTTGLLASAAAWAVTPMGMATIAIAGIWAITNAFNNYKKSLQESVDKVKELADAHKQAQTTMSQNVSSLESLKEKYNELSKGVKSNGENVSLSAESYAEYNSIVQQVINQVPDLVDGYDSEGQAIIRRNGLIDTAIAKQKEYYDIATATYLNTGSSIVEGINAANKQLEESLGYSGFWNGESIGEDLARQLSGGILGDLVQYWRENSIFPSLFGENKLEGFGISSSLLNQGDIDQLNIVRENMQALIEAFGMSEAEAEKFRETVQSIGIEMSSNSPMMSEYARYLTTWAFASKEQGGAIASGFEEFSKISDEYMDAFTKGVQNIANTPTPDLSTQKKELLELAQQYLKIQDVIPSEQVSNLNKKFAEGSITAGDYDEQVKGIKKALEEVFKDDPNFKVDDILLSFGFKIDHIDDLRLAIANSLGIDENDPKYQVIVDLTYNLKTDELANMQRYIAEATDTTEAEKRLNSLSKIFTPDNEKFLQNVRLIQMLF